MCTALVIDMVLNRDDAVISNLDLVHSSPGPRYARNSGVLCNDRGGNLVTQRAHR